MSKDKYGVYRKAIYDFVEANGFNLENGNQKELKKLLKNYINAKNESLLKELGNLKSALENKPDKKKVKQIQRPLRQEVKSGKKFSEPDDPRIGVWKCDEDKK